ncbi:MAG: DUF721 domain-containing protein [Nitrosomonadales bacterium]|nr:DUF721 domain-containing protein [Nitrosomonadales bacterium]
MAQRLKSLLSSGQEFGFLTGKTKYLLALQQHFASVAPPHLAESAQILGLHAGTLSVAVANPAIAAKLRQLAPELVVMLQNRDCEVSGIRVKVQVDYMRYRPPPTPRILTETARNALNELSGNMDDSPLKDALQRMARRKN